jgi:cell division FtsZ-interacting protein ZapD
MELEKITASYQAELAPKTQLIQSIRADVAIKVSRAAGCQQRLNSVETMVEMLKTQIEEKRVEIHRIGSSLKEDSLRSSIRDRAQLRLKEKLEMTRGRERRE